MSEQETITREDLIEFARRQRVLRAAEGQLRADRRRARVAMATATALSGVLTVVAVVLALQLHWESMGDWLADWVRTPGFGGAAAVAAAVVAFLGVRRSNATQRENARKAQWWDRLKWAVELALSPDEAQSAAGLTALEAITEATGFDPDEANFIANIANLFLGGDPSGRLEGEEDQS